MRSYTNRSLEEIMVSEEHLQTAMRIKLELQKSSPSRKCSWAQLVQLMAKEGFDDAENSENYRQMIKHYQKSVGELPTAPTVAELVTSNKLESIKELVGDIAYEKRENQLVLKELNKLKREVIDQTVMIERIAEVLQDHDWSKHTFHVEPRKSASGSKMIVCLSDMHIGALVDLDMNQFNFAIALARLKRFADHVVESATYNDISEIHIVNLGDVIEHSNMRYGQAFHSEFVYNEQIVQASDAIIQFIKAIAENGFHVTYAGIAGNHDRSNDKDKTIDGDHAVRPINKIVSMFMQNAGHGHMEYIQAKDYSHRLLDVNGKNFKFVHGDLDSFKNESLLAKHSDKDDIHYDAIISGHFHHFRDLEVGYRKRIVLFGSLKGPDEFGDKIGKLSVPSQGFLIVDAVGRIKVEQVELD